MSATFHCISGLPRSGTSMMMKMLEAGGIEPVVDHIRKSDEDNPRGYYEFEKVKKIDKDASWLGETRGKVVEKVTGRAKAGGHVAKASPDDPEYRVRSEASGKDAIHRPEALRKT